MSQAGLSAPGRVPEYEQHDGEVDQQGDSADRQGARDDQAPKGLPEARIMGICAIPPKRSIVTL